MLRLRPIRTTERLDAWTRLLEGLGLVKALDLGHWAEFDSAHGRVALQRRSAADPAAGTTRLAFEVGDLDEFASRTREAGTGVVISESTRDRTAVIAGPDGLEILATDEKPRLEPAGPSLHVMPLWTTPDAAGAVKTLRDLGAKELAPNGDMVRLAAKNGGRVGVRAGSVIGLELSFEYDGDAFRLLDRLADAGVPARVLEEPTGLTVHTACPDGGPDLRIMGRPAVE